MYKADYDMIVVGGGPGGYTAALYGARAGLSVLVLEMLSPGGQMATTENVDNYPGFPEGADGFELGEKKMQQGAHRFGAVTKFEEVKAPASGRAPKRVETGKGVYTARTVVLSTGANPRRLAVPGKKRWQAAVAFAPHATECITGGKEVAVLGGGNSAAEEALYLSKICP